MTLQDILKKENVKQAVKVVGAAAVGIGLAYTLNEVGFTPWLCETYNNAHGWFGEWNKNLAEFIYNHGGKYLTHAGIAMIGAVPTYLSLDELLK
jgi:hypothetical protein